MTSLPTASLFTTCTLLAVLTAIMAAALLLSPPMVQGQKPQQFFQLVAEDKTCLQIDTFSGTFAPCKHSNGGFSPNTVFLLNGDKSGSLNIEIFGTGLCLDREDCKSSISNLRSYDCDHCGAKRWSINLDGSISEDSGRNCIYRDSKGYASVRHCSDGFMKFEKVILGDPFY